jgi:HK97 family phage portal protein
MFFLPKAETDRSPWGDFWFTPVSSRTSSGVRVAGDQAMRLTAVYACVRNLSEDFAKIPIRLYKQPVQDGKRTIVTDHWLLRLMCKRPNKWQTPFNWREMVMGHLALRGNAFNELVVGGNGEVTDLLPIHPDTIKIELLDSGSFRYRVRQRDGTEKTYRRDQLWHLKGLSPDGYMGYNPIELQAEMLGAGMSAQEYASRFFANDARPSGGWIEFPGKFTDQTARKVFQESWQQGQGGRNRGKTAVLEAGMKFHEVMISNRDSQFIESRAMTVGEIARMFRMPPHKIADLSKATFSNIEQQSIEYGTDTISPWAERWESSIECDLLGEDSGLEVEFDLRQLMRGDSQARVTYYNGGINGGWLTRNEVRIDEGLDPLKGLDEPLQPLNMVEAANAPDELAENGAPDDAIKPQDGETGARLHLLLQGNAHRLARRIASGKPVSGEVVSEAMAVDGAEAAQWVANLIPSYTENEICESLMLLGKHGKVIEASHSARLKENTEAIKAAAPVVNVAAPVVNVEAPHICVAAPIVNVPPQKRVERTVERNEDGVISKLIDTPVDD